ncbi:hypothetical protein ACSS6N_14985 [Peribacillus frigoritolerans]|uniref:hypothetical protein n=1 Tax=Peribacillus frigoritolerans TaxID=450367 RepID=UPI003F84C4F3
MLYEFALTPEVFDKKILSKDYANYVILNEVLKGICINGTLANLDNNNWIKNVSGRINLLNPKEKDRLLSLIKTIRDRKRLVRYPGSITPNDDFEWLQLALSTHQNENFYSIVTEKGTVEGVTNDDPIVQLISDILNSEYWNNRPRTMDVKQNYIDYNKYLKTVLKNAKSLHLIDPYMSLEPRFFTTLKLCISLLKNSSVRIHIHCKINNGKNNNRKNNNNGKKTPTEYLNEWENSIMKLNYPLRRDKYKIFLWERRTGQQKFHDRSFITDQCGIGVEGD